MTECCLCGRTTDNGGSSICGECIVCDCCLGTGEHPSDEGTTVCGKCGGQGFNDIDEVL